MAVTTKELERIKQRHSAAVADRQQYDSYIDTAFRYSVPQRRIYLEAQNKLRPNPEIYDDTAVIGVQKFATKMQSMLVPSAQKWMRLEPGSDIPEEEQVNAQLKYDAQTTIFFEELEKSNFDMQVSESFQDLAITTGALIINPAPIGADSSITYKSIPINELSFEESDDGIIRNVWRQFDMRIIAITESYPEAKISELHKKAIEVDPTKSITIVESTIYDQKTRQSQVVLYEPSTNHIFLERLEDVGAIVVFRENVVSGAAFGFGRVLRVLPSIKTVNKIKELTLQGGSMAISGTFTAHDDGVLNPYNVRLRPGVTIPVNSNDTRNPSIARLDTPTNFDWSAFEVNDLRATINESLMSDPYGAINETPVRTATEIAARNSEIFHSVSSSLGRMQREFIAPVIKRTIYLLQKAGKLEEFALDGLEVKYKYISPLAKLQASADVENVLEWLGIVGTMGEEVTQLTVQMEAVPAWLGKQYGVPQELMRSPEQAAEVVEADEAKQMEQMAATDGLAGGIAPQELAGPMPGLEGMYG